MNKYIWVVIILIGVILTVTGLALTKNKTNYAPDETKISSDCKEYFYNKDAKVRIVFFANKETTEKYANYLLEASPYKENKDKMSIYYVDSYTPKCSIYKQMALYCKSNEIEKAAEKCAAEYIIAFDNQPSNIRSSTYLNVLSLNVNHPLNVILHEFAHAFGKLEDEYIPAKLTSKKKNCLAKCEDFEGKGDGCFEGCANDEYYRSIESGIMKSLKASDYGKYNKDLLQEEFH